MEKSFEKTTFQGRLKSMLAVDLRRMFTTSLIYVLIAACLVAPVVILVMTTMMDGTVTVDPTTNEETVIEGFDNVWQILGSVSGTASDESAAMDMGLTSMVNINMLYFAIAVLVCLFVGADFKSGYVKNLFTVRAKKSDYVPSKTLVCSLGAALMILAFFIGSLLGGVIAGLPFTMEGFTLGSAILSLFAKMLLVTVFVPIYLILSVAAKDKVWLSILLSLGTGMFLFMMIPMLTPLNATLLHPLFCLAGGVTLGFALGAGSKLILSKTSLV